MDELWRHLPEFIAAFAIVAILAASYGYLQRSWIGRVWGSVGLGILFGALSSAHFHSDFLNEHRLLLETSAAPIVLAGAFLSAQGLILCISIASVFRILQEGDAALSGVAVIVLTGLAGYVWQHLTAHKKKRTILQLSSLVVLAHLHLVALVQFPLWLSKSYLLHCGPAVFVMNAFTIIACGLFLRPSTRHLTDRVLSRSDQHRRQRHMLLNARDFRQQSALSVAAGGLDAVAGFLDVRIGLSQWHRVLMGERGLRFIAGAMGMVLRGVMGPQALIGITRDYRLVITLTAQELARVDAIQLEISREINDRGALLPDGTRKRIKPVMNVTTLRSTTEIADAIDTALSPSRLQTLRPNSAELCEKRLNLVCQNALFDKADLLFSIAGK